MERIIKELEEIETLKDQDKSKSMIYQYMAKMQLAKCIGVNLEKVDLPFDLWSALSREHYIKGCCVK